MAVTPSTGIDSAIVVNGEISAGEDMTLSGRVDGRVTLPEHHLTIASSARIKANIVARSVVVLGTVEGNILAEEHIHLLAGAQVRGHLTTPSIVLADGANFTGSIDPNRSETAMHVARYRERHSQG